MHGLNSNEPKEFESGVSGYRQGKQIRTRHDNFACTKMIHSGIEINEYSAEWRDVVEKKRASN